MSEHDDSTDRTSLDYILFALGFVGFLITVAGITLTTPALASVGAILLLFVISCFAVASCAEG